MADPPAKRALPHLFDIRNIVGALLGVYGVALTIAGFTPAILPGHGGTGAARNRVDLYIGTEANWWVGLILIGVAIGFLAWALLRPVRAEPSAEPSAEPIAEPSRPDEST